MVTSCERAKEHIMKYKDSLIGKAIESSLASQESQSHEQIWQKPHYEEVKMHSFIENGVLKKFDERDLDANKRITLPSDITEIDCYAFYRCKKVKEIILPQNVKTVGLGAFSSCVNLERVLLPSTLENLAPATFKDCWALKCVNLPTQLREIPFQCFLHCKSLETIRLPKTVTRICEQAFWDCEKLKYIDYSPEINLQYLAFDAFHNCDGGKLFLSRLKSKNAINK